MSLNRRIATNSLLLMLAQGSGRALGLLVLPWMTRLFAPDAFGTAALATTFISCLAVIALMGMDLSYTRAYLAEPPAAAGKVEIFAWRFALLSGLTAAAVGAVAWWLWGRQIPGATGWIGAGIVISVLVPMAQARARLQGNYRRLAAALAAGSILTAVMTLLAGWLSWQTGVALVAGTVAGFAVTLVILGWPRIGSAASLPTPEQRRAILLVGLPIVVTAPMYWVITSADRWFVVHFRGDAEAGVYAIAATLGSVGALFNTAVSAVWLPEATRLHESRGAAAATELGQVMSRIILAMALGWLLVAGLADEAVRILTAPPFHAAAAYVPWLAGAVFFGGLYQMASTGLVLDRRLGAAAIVWMVAAAAALVLNFLLVPAYGAMASARIQCLCMAGAALAVVCLAARRQHVPLSSGRLLVVLSVTVFAGIAMAPAWHAEPLISLFLKLPCLSILAALLVWLGEPGLLRRLKSRLLPGAG